MRSLFDSRRAARHCSARAFASPSTPCTPSPGPMRTAIFERELGAPCQARCATARRCRTSAATIPTRTWCTPRSCLDLMMSPQAPDLGAASDGDGDRNLIIGRGIFVAPSDSLAMLAANAHLAPAYRAGIAWRRALDAHQRCGRPRWRALGVPRFETPTGWKYSATCSDAGKVTLCGEESARHRLQPRARERRHLGGAAVAEHPWPCAPQSVRDIAQQHWATYGRNYYTRHDYEAIDGERAKALMNELVERLSGLKGQMLAGRSHPGRRLQLHRSGGRQRVGPPGLRIGFADGSRIVYRLSGTGTSGATLRVYIERFEPDPARHALDTAAGAGRTDRAGGADRPDPPPHRCGAAPDVVT